jgi:hypothetical protein
MHYHVPYLIYYDAPAWLEQNESLAQCSIEGEMSQPAMPPTISDIGALTLYCPTMAPTSRTTTASELVFTAEVQSIPQEATISPMAEALTPTNIAWNQSCATRQHRERDVTIAFARSTILDSHPPDIPDVGASPRRAERKT